ncbi:hypothetical protein BV22DRAFT_1108343 [Leucogyrophana mollusca]|uniref:Uncharacterized protein n=1 Tax=Leucogyrophana mollusca TaxID=85980 RepID=A0ACB8AYN5_9AGAM|nr:hypothetical protein BV22DRAFT_1108343 [Leucogyrophana mollusca]
MIRQDKNDGLAFQYDTVIRNQEQRKGMLAGDCECCRDYYDAIGSLPQRLQQPLWRSPASSPTKGRPCKADVESPEDAYLKEDADNVAQHKQEISKHRHHWHRAKTPPGYWNIGFPDTQEASDINHRAEQMHRQKMNLVEKEAG